MKWLITCVFVLVTSNVAHITYLATTQVTSKAKTHSSLNIPGSLPVFVEDPADGSFRTGTNYVSASTFPVIPNPWCSSYSQSSFQHTEENRSAENGNTQRGYVTTCSSSFGGAVTATMGDAEGGSQSEGSYDITSLLVYINGISQAGQKRYITQRIQISANGSSIENGGASLAQCRTYTADISLQFEYNNGMPSYEYNGIYYVDDVPTEFLEGGESAPVIVTTRSFLVSEEATYLYTDSVSTASFATTKSLFGFVSAYITLATTTTKEGVIFAGGGGGDGGTIGAP